jgi:hypothetical protein
VSSDLGGEGSAGDLATARSLLARRPDHIYGLRPVASFHGVVIDVAAEAKPEGNSRPSLTRWRCRWPTMSFLATQTGQPATSVGRPVRLRTGGRRDCRSCQCTGQCGEAHALDSLIRPRRDVRDRMGMRTTWPRHPNQVDSGVCERWKIVPAVAEVFNPQSAHIRSSASVRQQPPLPHSGHENPYGQRSPARHSRHVTSSGNHDRNS